jgi:signal transduction histidine kinase
VTRQTGNFYGRLWKNVPRELGFLLLAYPIALVGFVATLSLFTAGLGTIVTFFIGLILIIAALYVSRGFGTLELIRLQWVGRPAIPRPDWQDARARQGFWGWLRAVLGNGHYWLALLHTMIINYVVSLITWTLTVVWAVTGLGGMTYWFWQMFLPHQQHEWYFSRWIVQHHGVGAPDVGAAIADNFIYVGLGIVLLATLPFVTRGLVVLHESIARGVLGAWKSEGLQRQVAHLSASRGAASSAEGHSLRRLERDIHDGPQQRLVRLQMDLAAADRQLETDPEKARVLLAEAMQQSKDALEELRSLSRGFAPPILLDRGLVAALQSAATRSPIATTVVDDLPEGVALPQETERNAYFVASEALANAIKHSGATVVELRVSATVDTLAVVVTDNGNGGAIATEGHGLAGLHDRMRGLGGTLAVQSPAGGPTVVTAQLPLGPTLNA